MLLFWVSGLSSSSLVAHSVSKRSGYCSLCRSPQSAHTVSRHMALFDKGHKHSLINSSRSASRSSQFSGKTTWCFHNVLHRPACVAFVPSVTVFRLAADQSLCLYSPQKNKSINAAVSGCRIPSWMGREGWGRRARCWSLHRFSRYVMCHVSLLQRDECIEASCDTLLSFWYQPHRESDWANQSLSQASWTAGRHPSKWTGKCCGSLPLRQILVNSIWMTAGLTITIVIFSTAAERESHTLDVGTKTINQKGTEVIRWTEQILGDISVFFFTRSSIFSDDCSLRFITRSFFIWMEFE